MKRCINEGILTLLTLCACSSFAQHTVVLRDDQHDIALSPHAYIYPGDAPLSGIQALLGSDTAKFVRNNVPHEVDYGVGEPRGWCVFFIRNESGERDWILKIQQSRVDTVQLYVLRENKVIERLPMTGHFQTFSERPVQALPFAYSIPIRKNETLGFYLYTSRQYGKHAAVLNFQTKNYFETYEYGFNIMLSFVCGMVALASLMGFFLFLFVRQRLYVYYGIYAISFFFVLLADTGFAHAVLFFPLDQTVADGFTMISYYWMGGCLGVFTVELLQLKQHKKRWIYWFGIVLSYALCVIALLLLIPGLPHFVRWSFISSSYYLAFIINTYILYVISLSIHKKEPIVYFYMAGFFFTSFVALLLLLSDFQIINFSHQNKDIYFLTPFVEILCVALGIGIHFSKVLKARVNVQLALNETQNQIISIQENERRRIAQDLHDDVGNSLVAIRNMVIRKDDAARIEKEIDDLINTTRSISHDLMPVNFDEFSLAEVIEHTVSKFEDHPSLMLEFNHTGKVTRLKPLFELVIYRIISELITNILKHAQATRTFIQLVYQEASLVVTVEDNGTGIKNSKMEEGIGLRSIRLRADYIRARLKIESDNKGTLIILEVPYENNR